MGALRHMTSDQIRKMNQVSLHVNTDTPRQGSGELSHLPNHIRGKPGLGHTRTKPGPEPDLPHRICHKCDSFPSKDLKAHQNSNFLFGSTQVSSCDSRARHSPDSDPSPTFSHRHNGDGMTLRLDHLHEYTPFTVINSTGPDQPAVRTVTGPSRFRPTAEHIPLIP